AGEGEGQGPGEGEGAAEGEGEGIPPPGVVCPAPLAAVDLGDATVVGDGSAGSCTEAELDNALANHASKIALRCGDAPVSIAITSEKVVSDDLVIDGGGTVTLDGGGSARILRIDSTFDVDTPHVTLQNLTLAHGQAPASTELDGGGGAISRVGGTLDLIAVNFVDNHGNGDGQDTAGGAIFSEGGGFTNVVGCTFSGNRCSNGGALGNLGNDLVVVNSDFDDNAATGSGGNPGDGGNGGTISIDGQGRSVTVCGVHITRSVGNAFGGAIFRVAYAFTEPTDIDRLVVDGASIPDQDPSLAGALYLQGTVVTMQASTIENSSASGGGAAFFGPSATVHLVNDSFFDNTASSGLGGALFVSGLLGGEIDNCTFVGNSAPGDGGFGGAIVGDGGNVALENTLILDSAAGNGFNPVSCTTELAGGVGSFQFPVARSGGGSDDPDALCGALVKTVDVPIGDVDTSGVVPVRVPAASSPALGAGRVCPQSDALGNPRSTDACTAGAVEVAP
ncbi:MAG TPA: hypothetical protein VGO62_12310, partial [Myxococcota bacterium]